MAVLFDPKNGTDRVATGATVDTPSNWTACMWMRKTSTTGGQLFSIDAAANIDVYYSSSTTDRLTIDRQTDGTTAQFQVTGANDGIAYSASQWVFIAISQTGRSTPTVYTASPVQAVALGTRTVTVANAGTGTATTAANGVAYIGNWSGFDYALGGDIAWFGFHNVILTAGEIEEAMWRGLTTRGLVLATSLESTAKLYDLSGNAHALTNTGAADTSAAEPPVSPLWLPTADGWVPVEAGVTEHFGASASTWTFTKAVAGFATKAGATASTFTLNRVTAGFATKAAASASTWTLTATTAGVRVRLGATSSTWTLGATTAGAKTTFGASATTVTFSAISAGFATKSGASASTFTFAATTAGTRTRFGAASLPITFSATTAGDVSVGATEHFGASASTWTLGATTAGFATKTGATASTFTFVKFVSGFATKTAATASTYTFTKAAAGTRTTFGSSSLTVALGASSEAILGAFGIVAMPIVLNITTRPVRPQGGADRIRVVRSSQRIAVGSVAGSIRGARWEEER